MQGRSVLALNTFQLAIDINIRRKRMVHQAPRFLGEGLWNRRRAIFSRASTGGTPELAFARIVARSVNSNRDS